jgi:NAD(P)-dependent dehydrogenase (short-subunit alcohol dehydrogenase family)
MHPSIRPGGVAVVTGSAAGIGLAIAERLAKEQMKVVLFDENAVALDQAASSLLSRFGHAAITKVQGDVTSQEALDRLQSHCSGLGPLSLLINNAGVIPKAGPWDGAETWQRVMDVNFWSVLRLQQLFIEKLISQRSPSAIVNLGSKEGITTPPGNAAYAVSKAALRVLTEQLSHELRQRCDHVTAHLLIPGYTFTPMNFPEMSRDTPKPKAAWSAEQVVDRMVERMDAGDFYLFCEDNEVTRDVDQRRMQWSADDLILNRPALSRWHPDYQAKFARFLHGETAP